MCRVKNIQLYSMCKALRAYSQIPLVSHASKKEFNFLYPPHLKILYETLLLNCLLSCASLRQELRYVYLPLPFRLTGTVQAPV